MQLINPAPGLPVARPGPGRPHSGLSLILEVPNA
uniref:Uncharacterized protein n=1 Tax=Anguilla anguilla TaxID=7936 RepID=A0A0E9R5E5_ANGAN